MAAFLHVAKNKKKMNFSPHLLLWIMWVTEESRVTDVESLVILFCEKQANWRRGLWDVSYAGARDPIERDGVWGILNFPITTSKLTQMILEISNSRRLLSSTDDSEVVGFRHTFAFSLSFSQHQNFPLIFTFFLPSKCKPTVEKSSTPRALCWLWPLTCLWFRSTHQHQSHERKIAVQSHEKPKNSIFLSHAHVDAWLKEIWLYCDIFNSIQMSQAKKHLLVNYIHNRQRSHPHTRRYCWEKSSRVRSPLAD